MTAMVATHLAHVNTCSDRLPLLTFWTGGEARLLTCLQGGKVVLRDRPLTVLKSVTVVLGCSVVRIVVDTVKEK